MEAFTDHSKTCPLCPALSSSPTSQPNTQFYHQDKQRVYWHCNSCDLVFVPEDFHLSLADQKSLYDLHENHECDPGYRKFLERMATALSPHLRSGDKGLDFGCGPATVLSCIFKELGFPMQTYDPIYQPHTQLLEQQFDFVTATEVVEHFTQPSLHLQQLWHCVRPGGWLGIMTKMVISPEAFSKWHYIRDPTHVTFFSQKSFDWLAKKWHTCAYFYGKDIIVMRKNDPAS